MDLDAEWNKTGTTTVRYEGRDIMFTLASVPASKLTLDPDNKRLWAITQGKYHGEPLTQEQARDELWSMSSVKQLFQGILISGGLGEALIVNRNGKVVEGNERLTAIQHIAEGLEEDVFSENERPALEQLIGNVPVKVLPVDITAREIAMMLAQEHLGGKDPWDSMNQSRHIYEMHHDHGIPIQDISYQLRKSRPWVYQKLRAYEMAKEHFERGDRWEKTSEFSFFEEAYKKKKALKDVGMDLDDQEDRHRYMDMVAGGQIPRAIAVRKLPKVLQHEETRALLEAGNGAKAFSTLALVDAAEASPRFAAIDNLNRQLGKMNWDDYKKIKENNSYRQLIVETIDKLQRTLETVEGMNFEEWDE